MFQRHAINEGKQAIIGKWWLISTFFSEFLSLPSLLSLRLSFSLLLLPPSPVDHRLLLPSEFCFKPVTLSGVCRLILSGVCRLLLSGVRVPERWPDSRAVVTSMPAPFQAGDRERLLLLPVQRCTNSCQSLSQLKLGALRCLLTLLHAC